MIGLVLEGGGMRGLYTAGVLDVMMEHGWRPDVICGTSAGVTFGINLPSGQPGRVVRYNTRFANDKRYISYQSLLHTGNIVNTEFAYGRLPDELDPFDYEAFRTSGIRFYATITNIRTGKAEYVLLTDGKVQMDVVRASASLPFLSQPVAWNGEEYLDGGIVDNIPLDKCLSEGCDKLIVVLTRPKGYLKDDHLTLLSRLFYRRYPALQAAFRRRNADYRRRIEQLDRLEAEGKIVVLRPSTDLPVARLEHDPERLKALHQLGITDTRERWQTIEDYLAR